MSDIVTARILVSRLVQAAYKDGQNDMREFICSARPNRNDENRRKAEVDLLDYIDKLERVAEYTAKTRDEE